MKMAYPIKTPKMKEQKSKELRDYEFYKGKLKKVEWENPNKMKFDSSFKVFNKQTDLITTGNVYSNTQTSAYIRPYNEVINPVGEKREKGFLQDWDLNNFTNLPYNVREDIKNKAKEKSVILYEFKHYNKDRKVVDGYVLTDNHYKHLKTYYTNPNFKSQDAVNEASKYISWKEE